jgi:hypothetical protein
MKVPRHRSCTARAVAGRGAACGCAQRRGVFVCDVACVCVCVRTAEAEAHLLHAQARARGAHAVRATRAGSAYPLPAQRAQHAAANDCVPVFVAVFAFWGGLLWCGAARHVLSWCRCTPCACSHAGVRLVPACSVFTAVFG